MQKSMRIKSVKAVKNIFFISTSIFILAGCATAHHPTKLHPNLEFKKTEIPPIQSQIDYPLSSEKGFEQFIYGGSQPVVHCRPFELSVITLEKGENVSSVSSGDPLRWSYSIVYSGQGQEKEAQIMVKPTQANISTDLVITTTKRMYTLKLVSTAKSKYLRNIKFAYPDEMQKEEIQAENQDLMGIHLNQLNFNYDLNSPFFSSVRWKPIRVFDDGTHTFIQMPDCVNSEDLPVIYSVDENSNEKDEKMLVNYRYKKPYFVVDKLFKKAVMLLGVGHNQSQVTITNGGI